MLRAARYFFDFAPFGGALPSVLDQESRTWSSTENSAATGGVKAKK